jgi:predicted Mrr-cat superfamily restriction endonuclease
MNNAWVIRPNPHHINRVKEFLKDDIVAIGWPKLGNLEKHSKRSEIKKLLRKQYPKTSNQSIGQKAGIIYRFRSEIEKGDYIVMPDGPIIYIGKIKDNKYGFKENLLQEGYPNHRNIEWLFDKKGIKRNFLYGRVFDSLKGRQTVFSISLEDISEIVKNKEHLFNENPYVDLKRKYIERLQSGKISGLNSSTFEDAVSILLSEYFPGLERQSTGNSKTGDTDLKTELPGNIVVRIQVKYFYKSGPKLDKSVVDQLANSMDDSDIGIIVTSDEVSESSENYADLIENNIGFIDGVEFVDLLFESLNEIDEKELHKFGLSNQLEMI